MRSVLLLTYVLTTIIFTPARADATISCHFVGQAPVIDGDLSDPAWASSESVPIQDNVANLQHDFNCVHDGQRIYLGVAFPDTTESRNHKSHMWDNERSRYRIGPQREDTLIIKWGISGNTTDLSLSATAAYKADIWYWKAHRSDHAGFADDKHHSFSKNRERKSKPIFSRDGQQFYLRRKGDDGDASYRTIVHTQYTDDVLNGFKLGLPTKSRADIRAKGQWSNNRWHIEFSRNLITGHSDDVQLNVGQSYHFGVSRYEIAGRKRNESLEIPDFGAGDISQTLTLILKADQS